MTALDGLIEQIEAAPRRPSNPVFPAPKQEPVMTEPVSAATLQEMLEGLEGVTPGPWELSIHGDHSQYFGNIIGNYGPNEFGVKSIRTISIQLRYGQPEEQRANGDHIARCDPDTMRQIITLAQEALALRSPISKPAGEPRPLVDELTGALRFIMAFYDPGQTYLDTNAWRVAEAGGRAALAKGEAFLTAQAAIAERKALSLPAIKDKSNG